MGYIFLFEDVNQPDNYFFSGGSRTGMGYDEQQYSLPRWKDISISRQGLFDDLYSRLPTQGWMFVRTVLVYQKLTPKKKKQLK
jgi:hypothetical protein